MRIIEASRLSARVLAKNALAYYAGDMAQPLSVKIRKLRQSLGENQSQFAMRFGVKQASVSRWEKGSMPDPPLVAALADLAGETVREFIGMEEGQGTPLPSIPILGKVPAGKMREAYSDVTGSIPRLDPSIPPRAYALEVDGDSMDKVAAGGATIVVDPDDTHLFPLELYVVRSGGEVTFKQFQDAPARLVPLSTNPEHEVIFITSDRDWEVEGKVLWVAKKARYAAFD